MSSCVIVIIELLFKNNQLILILSFTLLENFINIYNGYAYPLFINFFYKKVYYLLKCKKKTSFIIKIDNIFLISNYYYNSNRNLIYR